ncbi:heavy metal translocating P-type ATPase [Cyclobacterium salsum]|uniref:heavy metal translocating P-type ATPase n=1 Tax=Cyclobacterium salsum TaxID=2666329 RepID=UPI00139157C9|nr:heavy metal translocating P-type ATPase [Cyclobacterium salsum]
MGTSSSHSSCCDQPPESPETGPSKWSRRWELWRSSILSLLILLLAVGGEYLFPHQIFTVTAWLPLYLLAYALVGWPVLKKGGQLIFQGEVFTEFFLMGIATIGAFAIGEYPEAVAVMLFYTIGEVLQHQAVSKAKGNVQALLDLRPNRARVIRDGKRQWVQPEKVHVGEILEIRPGERVPLDGVLQERYGNFNTAAITGESMPARISEGQEVLAGMVTLQNLITLRVSRSFQESSLSKIIRTVQQATAKKAKTEEFIRKFAKVYTPIVSYLALALVVLPYFFVTNYQFSDWLYRALVFLVISCPCALVISIPLGYFGGIGAASRKGILFKGSNYLDIITQVNTVIFDKTGTLTKGVFSVQQEEAVATADPDWRLLAISLEAKSNHPIALALVKHLGKPNDSVLELEEHAGQGLSGQVRGKQVLVGNRSLMEAKAIPELPKLSLPGKTLVYAAVEGEYCGYFALADEIKPDALEAFTELRKLGIAETGILSGDRQEIVEALGKELGANYAFGGLLPDEKSSRLEELKRKPGSQIAFVGDGINDAPALAVADLGIAMGGLGSDLAIETADVVIQTDHPSRVALALRIGKTTRRIVWQNIGLAFGVKLLVLTLGALGLAGMWEAVFADVGVALLAILNAIRITKIYK